MKRNHLVQIVSATKRQYALTLLIICLGLSLTSCKKQTIRTEMEAPSVAVAKVLQQEVQLYKDYTGKTEANASVSIPARVKGVLEKMTFNPGQIVKQGEPLFLIEQTQYLATLNRATAQLDSQRAFEIDASANYERGKELMAKGAAITQEDFDERKKEYDQAVAAVKEAEATLIEAKLNYSYTDIHAPIDGIISRNLIDIGNLVGGTVGTFESLATINNINPIYVYFSVSDRDFYRFIKEYGQPKVARFGMGDEKKDHADNTQENNARKNGRGQKFVQWPFVMQLLQQKNDDFAAEGKDDISTYPYSGQITYVDNTINPDTASIMLRGEISNPDNEIYAGWACKIKIPVEKIPNALVVYEKAVGTDLENRYMFVVTPDNHFERRIVKIGDSIGNHMCIIESGLKPGETYIVEGLQKVIVGKPVNPKPYAPPKSNEEKTVSTPNNQVILPANNTSLHAPQ